MASATPRRLSPMWMRTRVLAGAGPDLIAFETIPNKLEAQVNLLADRQVTEKPVVVYPNSGETYIAETKEWVVGALASSRN
ncbi:hypothetical protein EJB05_10887, partial [Eragrostis curvula]